MIEYLIYSKYINDKPITNEDFIKNNKHIYKLYYEHNQLSNISKTDSVFGMSLENNPPNIQTLHCMNSINNIQPNLQTLHCMNSINNIQPNLQTLQCWDNKLAI